MKIFVSQPRGMFKSKTTGDELRAAGKWARQMLGGNFELTGMSCYLWKRGCLPADWLSKNKLAILNSDLVIMVGDWRKYGNCRVEQRIAVTYGIPCVSLEGGFIGGKK